MKVNPEVIPPTKNLFYGHLKILTVSARILGLNNTHRCFIDWLIVPCVPIFFCGGCLFALIKLNIIFDAHVSTILRVVETIQLIASVFLVVANSLNAFNANRAVKKALRDLNLLEIQMASTKIKGTNYNRRITSVVLQLVVYSVIVLSVLLVHILFQHEVVHHPGIFYVIRFFPIYSIGVNVLQFVNIVAEVSSRLKALSGLVDQHISKDNPVPGRQLQLISVVYEMAFKVCKTLNDAFQFCNLFQIGYCFISITAKMFFVFLTLNNLHEATVQDMMVFPWLCVLVTPVILLSWACQALKNHVKALVGLLFKAQTSQLNETGGKMERIDMVLEQIQHQSIRFSTCGFFDIDTGLIFAFTGAVTTYLVFLLQFNITSTNDEIKHEAHAHSLTPETSP